ncbi:MAG: hypothetical protein Q8P20_01225 [bacterium]|nr:hypothetical protein [bacterium]
MSKRLFSRLQANEVVNGEHLKIDCVLQSAEADKKGYVWDVRIIKYGQDKNKRVWTKEVLQSALNLFEGAKVFLLDDSQHTEGDKSVKQIAGWLSSVKAAEDALVGKLNLVQSGTGTIIRDILQSSFSVNPELIGLSVDCLGQEEILPDGTRKVLSIVKAAVDIVHTPAADGKFMKMVASANAEASASADKIKASQDLASLQASFALELEKAKIGNTQLLLETKLQSAKLPEVANAKLKAQFAGKSLDEKVLDQAIQIEKQYLDIIQAQTVKDLGSVRILADDMDNRIKMFDDLMDGKVNSIKAAYVNFTGDNAITGLVKNCSRLTASLDSTSFASVLGETLNRKMLKEWSQSHWNRDWNKVCEITTVPDFKTQHRVRFGGYGDLPIVLESAPYTAATSPTDEQATFSVAKHGYTENVTFEMIKNDDINAIRRIPKRMGVAAARTLYKFVFDFFTTNAAIYDNVVLFHAATHANLGTTAFSNTELAVVRKLMMKQTEKDTNEVLGIFPKIILNPIDLEATVWAAIVAAGRGDFTPTSPDFVRDQSYSNITVMHWTDATDWYAIADPSMWPGLEIGFLDGKIEPEMWLQSAPTVGSVFSNDIITWKLRHVYGGVITDYRPFYRETVAG